jgi:inner membrane protein
MDTLTHALSGALLGRVTAPCTAAPGGLTLRARIALGFVAGAFPDSDIVVSPVFPLAYLYNHRGVTHSFVMLPLWAALLGLACAWLLWREPARWRTCAAMAALAIGAHIVADLITPYGTMIFAPLTDVRYAWSTTFIIDLWFSGIILTGLIACAIWRSSRLPAVVALAVLVAYVGFQYLQRQRALDFGVAHARAEGFPEYQVDAVPQPPLPFNWNVIVTEPARQHYSLVSLLRREPPPPLAADAGFFTRIGAPYMPPAHAVWLTAPRYGSGADDQALAREAWEHPKFGFYRWFAAHPALYRIDRGASPCVWFEDLRFFTPGRGRMPFRYGMCREAGEWHAYELRDDGRRAVN